MSHRAYFVPDTGVGTEMSFDPPCADTLLGVFQKLHRQDPFEGTRLGPATVQRTSHRYGGRIRAESEPDSGAAFPFLRSNPLQNRSRKKERTRQRMTNPETVEILLVEGDPPDAKLTLRALRTSELVKNDHWDFNSYIQKRVSVAEFQSVIQHLGRYPRLVNRRPPTGAFHAA